MRVVLIGAGEVGQHIAKTLSAQRHDVTLIEQDPARAAILEAQLDAMVFVGNGASPKALIDVEVGEADLLLAVTEKDEVNVIAALAAHQLGAKQTVARVRDNEYFGSKGDSFARDVLGIDFIIHPERATAEDLAAAILLPGAVNVEYFADGQLAVAEVILTERSPLINVPLLEREMVRPNYIVGVVRGGETKLAAAREQLQVGDHVLVAATREHVGPVVANLAGHARRVRDIIIFGGGRIGLPLARRLEEHGGFTITVVESDAARARHVAERLPGSRVLHEEGISKEAMLLNGVDTADAFVACAGDDRANLLAAMHAKQLGAGLCLSVVSREEYVPLVDGLGIDAAFSPRLVTAEAILRFVRGDNVRAMHLLITGAEVLEVCADAGCHAEGRTLSNAGLPRGCRIAAILRDGVIIIPRDDERIRAEDRVVIFGVPGASHKVQQTFNR